MLGVSTATTCPSATGSPALRPMRSTRPASGADTT